MITTNERQLADVRINKSIIQTSTCALRRKPENRLPYLGNPTNPHLEKKWINHACPSLFLFPPSSISLFKSHLLYHHLTFTMGVVKKTLVEGNNVDYPKKGEHVALHYTGCLYDASKTDNHCMGKK